MSNGAHLKLEVRSVLAFPIVLTYRSLISMERGD